MTNGKRRAGSWVSRIPYKAQVQVHASMNPSTTSSIASLGNIGRWAVAPCLHPLIQGFPHSHKHTHGEIMVKWIVLCLNFGPRNQNWLAKVSKLNIVEPRFRVRNDTSCRRPLDSIIAIFTNLTFDMDKLLPVIDHGPILFLYLIELS